MTVCFDGLHLPEHPPRVTSSPSLLKFKGHTKGHKSKNKGHTEGHPYLPKMRVTPDTLTTCAAAASTSGGNVDDYGTYSGHNCHGHSSPAVQTCCAPACRQLKQPQHSPRSGQQQPCQPQGTHNSKNGSPNRAANAIAKTSTQDELNVDFLPTKMKNLGPGGLPRDEDRQGSTRLPHVTSGKTLRKHLNKCPGRTDFHNIVARFGTPSLIITFLCTLHRPINHACRVCN